jgi:predicted XRE-type DNA-binding protein
MEVAVSEEIIRAGEDVFEDLGFSPEEAANLKVRSTLMASIRSIIERDGLTQARAAEVFRVSQPRVSDLVRGKVELFSIDALVNMLGAAGRQVELTIQPPVDRAA